MAEQAIRHASAVKPITIPVKADVTPDNVDRVQSISGGVSQPSEKVYEVGRLDKVCTDKGILEQSTSITQLEYGKNDMFLQLAGLTAEPAGGITLSDFNSSLTDIYQPGKTEYGGTVEQTLWLPKAVVDSIGIDIADAEARIERSFELSGDKFKILKEANKYLIFKEDDAGSGVSGSHDIDLSDPAPVEDPNNTGVYILQLYRIRSGVATELELTTDYTYVSGTTTLTIIDGLAGDNYRIWYSAGSYGTAGDPFVLNDTDDCFLKANSVTVLINDGTHSDVELDLLTSLSISATLNRINEAVVGSDEKVLKDVETTDVTVSLDGRIKDSTIEEALMGQAGQSWGIIDPDLFGEVSVTVKIYEDSTKSSFLIGYKMTGLSFSDESRDFDANAFGTKPLSLEGTNLLITETEGNL